MKMKETVKEININKKNKKSLKSNITCTIMSRNYQSIWVSYPLEKVRIGFERQIQPD